MICGGFAGFVFSFSNHHFAHLEGHLHIVSMEWLPIFVWLWLRMLDRPSAARGALCALALTANLLCAPYFFLYAVMIAALLTWDRRHEFGGLRGFLEGPALRRAFAGLVGVAAATSGPWIVALLWQNFEDSLLGAHSPRSHSMDLLAPLIPGGHWRFAAWTEAYWSRIPSNIHENSVQIGTAVIAAMVWVWRQRERLAAELWRPWFRLALGFAVLSLGPALFVGGIRLLPWGLPYAVLRLIFPPLELAGVPVRMMIVTQLAAAVLMAVAISKCWPGGRKGAALLVLAVAWTGFEYWPRPVTTTDAAVPGWVAVLRALPGDGVADLTTAGGQRRLIHQAHHEKRVVGGYLSRVPESVEARSAEILRAAEQRDPRRLCDEGVRYLVLGGASPEFAAPADARAAVGLRGFVLRHADERARILELQCGP